MTDDSAFTNFKLAIQRQWTRMANSGPLFRVALDKDTLWQLYLASFPEGTNPLFRKRSWHDCGCCRHWIKTIGNVVSIDENNELVTIWDCETREPYATVATLSTFVRSHPVETIFLHTEYKVGTDKNYEDQNGSVHTWEHFFIEIPRRNERPFVCSKADVGPKTSDARSTHDVLLRGLID